MPGESKTNLSNPTSKCTQLSQLLSVVRNLSKTREVNLIQSGSSSPIGSYGLIKLELLLKNNLLVLSREGVFLRKRIKLIREEAGK